jgi:type IV pilus assembly protein PilB
MQRRLPIGEMLLQQGRISDLQLRTALSYQRQWGGRLGHALLALGFVDEAAILATLARQLGIPLVEIGDRRVPPAVVRQVPERLLRARRAFPLAIFYEARRATLLVALSEPQNLEHLDEIAFASGMPVKPALAADADIERAFGRHFSHAPASGAPAAEPPIEVPPVEKGERMELVERPKTPRTWH